MCVAYYASWKEGAEQRTYETPYESDNPPRPLLFAKNLITIALEKARFIFQYKTHCITTSVTCAS